MSWNCRGLGNPWAVQALKRVIKKEDPSFGFSYGNQTNSGRDEKRSARNWLVTRNCGGK